VVRIAVLIGLGIAFIAGWELLARYLAIPKYILPARLVRN
jgi:ABC-type nitrate/sulfonate/bicarbonate transport system permease component